MIHSINRNLKIMISSFVLVIFLIIFGLILFFFSSSSTDLINQTSNYYSYTHTRFDPNTKTKSKGIVTFSRELEEDISYTSRNDQILNLISSNNDDQFMCTGTCYCDGDQQEERRIIATTAKRGVKILLSALTVTTAIKLSQTRFQKECEEKLFSDDECSKSIIRSEVDDCFYMSAEEMIKSVQEQEEAEKKKISPKKDEDEDETKGFLCTGNCIPNKGLSTEQDRRLAKKFDCSKLMIEEDVYITISKYELSGLKKKDKTLKFIKLAETEFQNQHLHKFCIKNSKTFYELKKQMSSKKNKKGGGGGGGGGGKKKKKGKGKIRGFRRKIVKHVKDNTNIPDKKPLRRKVVQCVGGGGSKNTSIRCVEIQ